MDNPMVAKLVRGGQVECVYRGLAAVVENGRLIHSVGDPKALVSLRSTAKPFFLIPFLTAPGWEKYGLTGEELAVMSSSHNAEKRHRQVIAGLLGKIGLSPANLHLGWHMPKNPQALEDFFAVTDPNQRQLFHNCSGKHTGFLLMCRHFGYPLEGYWQEDHPLQIRLKAALIEYLELDKDAPLPVSLDGCGVPNFFVPLERLAFGYGQMGAYAPFKPLIKAIRENPFMIGGTDRVDSALITECGAIAKAGAEGVFGVCLPEKRIGLAVKIESGHDEAAAAVAIEMLYKLKLISAEALEKLEKYRRPALTTTTGHPAGRLEAVL